MQVTELWRYPVKSTRGESLDRADVGPHGIAGDRQWAIVDLESGMALTARREPRLLSASSRLVDEATCEIALEDGTVVTGDEALSDWLGRAVTLTRARDGVHGSYEIAADFEDERHSEWVSWEGPDGSFHDSTRTMISVLAVPSTRHWDPRRFRANVLLDVGDEQDLVGTTIRIGSVEATVGKRIDRCVMTTRPQPGGIERDLDVLRTINRELSGVLGAGALITRPGTIQIGDEVERGPLLS
jgi:uncharacterized protein YcbX